MTPKRCVVQAVFDSCWHSREADAPIRLTFGLVELAPGLSILPQPSHYGQRRGLKMRKANTKHEPVQHASGGPGSYLSADDRRAAGKALRDVTPRAAHGGWKPPEDRRDPVELLREANEGRIAELIPLRFRAWPNRLSPSIAARPRSWRPIWRRPRRPDFAFRPAA